LQLSEVSETELEYRLYPLLNFSPSPGTAGLIRQADFRCGKPSSPSFDL